MNLCNYWSHDLNHRQKNNEKKNVGFQSPRAIPQRAVLYSLCPTPEPGLSARLWAVHLAPLKVPGIKTGLEKAKMSLLLQLERGAEKLNTDKFK